MEYRLTQEEKLIEVALWFANLERVQSTRQVEDRFAEVTGAVMPLQEDEAEVYEKNDRQKLRDWLTRIVAGNTNTKAMRDRKAIAAEVSSLIQRTVSVGLVFHRARFHFVYGASGVQAACALAVALILDWRGGLATRLRQCKACGNFMLDFRPSKGKPKVFCSEACRKRGGVRRVQKWRKEHGLSADASRPRRNAK